MEPLLIMPDTRMTCKTVQDPNTEVRRNILCTGNGQDSAKAGKTRHPSFQTDDKHSA
jgi:hypothetical protein